MTDIVVDKLSTRLTCRDDFTVFRQVGEAIRRFGATVGATAGSFGTLGSTLRRAQSPAFVASQGWQSALRTPPRDWLSTPSPRLFDIDADDWSDVAWSA